MNLFVFRQALSDFLRFRRLVVWILVAGLVFGIGYAFVQFTEGEKSEMYTLISSIVVYRVVALAAAILSMGVIAQEIEQKTIVYLLTRPIPRYQLLLLRTLAATVVVMLVATLATLAASVAVYGVGPNPYLGRDLVALAVGSLAYTSLFVVVSLLINRAMIVCLLFAFGWEMLIPNMPGDLHLLSINSYIVALAQKPSVSGSPDLLQALGGLGGTNLIPLDRAWMILLLIVAATLVFGGLWFSTQEYVPREDAE